VLVVDESTEEGVLSRLPLPGEVIGCLYYQGVDYQVISQEPGEEYDIILKYWDLGVDRLEAVDLVVTDWERFSLQRAVELAIAADSLLLIMGVPENALVKPLLARYGAVLSKGQVVEMGLRKKDIGVFLRQEHGMKVSLHRLSGKCISIFRYLTEKLVKEEACG